MKRRDFIKTTLGGVAALVVGSKVPGILDNPAYAAFPVPLLDFTITDAIKEMATHNAINTAECYFWVYKEANFPADCPGPTIFCTAGDTINIKITNALDEPHNFVIQGIFSSGTIAPGATVTKSFTVPLSKTGTHLYLDSLNAPVNRVMGLHGAFIVMPSGPVAGNKWTPYRTPTPQVQQLFNDLGNPAGHFPGLAWEQGDPATLTAPFRQYVWLCHQASPTLFRDVGDYTAGLDFPAADFKTRFLRDGFSRNSHNLALSSDIPQYFTITGQSGFYCHGNPVITPWARVGEPVMVRVLNAGMMSHSMHLHANHFYILSVDGVVQGNPNPADPTLTGSGPIWLDTMTLNPFGSPSAKYDMLIPYMRPPDVPNTRGIGRGGSGDAALDGTNSHQPVWPCVEEYNLHMPAGGTCLSSIDGQTLVPLKQRMSPLCYPMHDHSEPSQTTQGGNYNTALISGMYIIGDRNITLPRFNIGDNPALPLLPPHTFPIDEDVAWVLGLDQNPQYICYGCYESWSHGIMEASKDNYLPSQGPRPPWPPL